MAATPSVEVIYSIVNRDGTKTVSNRHHFLGGTPASSGAWETLFDAIAADFVDCISTDTTITRMDGFAAGSDVAAHSQARSDSGTVETGISDSGALPGFCCALIRWSTDQKTSKNHPIYLFSYVHGIICSGGGSSDAQQLSGPNLTGLQTFADNWVSPGYSDGTNSYTRAGPNGAAAIDDFVDQYIREHELSPT